MIYQKTLATDCLTAARQRICNIFANGLPVYVSFSGGKDSLALAHVICELIREGKIDPRQVRIEFVDEEAIFPCVERVCLEWRERFLTMGVPFYWYCIEVMHHSCLNMLENDESFICWDREKRDVWVREPPPFAITSHPAQLPREVWPLYLHGKTYQDFLARFRDGVHLTGIRASESLQRRQFLAKLPPSGISGVQNTAAPLFDWTDDDIWLYLRTHNIGIPDAYLHLYAVGVSRNKLRISQFFSIDTVPSLARVAEFYPGLMERILRREPSAYLVSLYWDSEMFRRRSATRRDIEQAEDAAIDWRKRFRELLADPPQVMRRSNNALRVFRKYQQLALKWGAMMTDKHCRIAAEAMLAGDPKARVIRALVTNISRDYNEKFKTDTASGAPAAGQQRQAGAARPTDPQRLQPQRRARRQSGAAGAVDPDKRLDTAHRGAA